MPVYDDDERICERCCERSDDVKLTDFQDGTGHWNLCEACRLYVEVHGEESE
jgi:hypothetical protein